ncbi:response regulator [Micromonospora auratinigra]|uniref:Two component transcriptional regulator, LuxR family n=1 Tax=Micromonospora auratinigra TaxID=261654 RepID=A0A1A8ZA45_9ACTN|nr:response regulator transcription factor [Micromonospora auratinigra]SBT40838.1 two component transcriptional regulator, LuxR family [Micromonospora auratinigra]
MSIRVLICDDQASIRGAFRIILDAQPDMTVVGDAANGLTAIEQARHLRPDVVLADIRMPGADGLEVTRALAGPQVPDPMRVVIVTTFDLDEYVHTALRNGASGFLLKRSSPTLLAEGVRAAHAGDALISPQVTMRLLGSLRLPDSRATAPAQRLTERESQIAQLIGQGQTNAQIAEVLFLSPGTVKNHTAAIQRKLGTQNRVGIAIWAYENGLVAG